MRDFFLFFQDVYISPLERMIRHGYLFVFALSSGKDKDSGEA